MTQQAIGLLYYLRRYLGQTPGARKRLSKWYARTMKTPLDGSTIWRHTSLKTEPNMSQTFAYLTFLHREKAIATGLPALFRYSRPELLKPKSK